MRRVWSLLFICAILMQLCSCGAYEIMTADSNAIDEMSEEIIRCLIEKDRDTLEELFCPQVRNNENFEAQMDELYDFFDYDHYIRCDLDGSHAESESQEGGKRVEWSVCAEIIYLEVVDGEESRFYGIQYDWTPIYEENAALVGLHTISIKLLNTEKSVMVGTEHDFPF